MRCLISAGSGSNGAHWVISGTYGHLVFWRGFIENVSTKVAVENSKKFAKVYQLSDAKSSPPMKFINVSGKEFNTVHANSFKVYGLCSGKCRARIFEHEGRATDSPTPRINRIDSSSPNPHTRPVATVDRDQSKNPAARIQLASKWSTSQPMTNCITV